MYTVRHIVANFSTELGYFFFLCIADAENLDRRGKIKKKKKLKLTAIPTLYISGDSNYDSWNYENENFDDENQYHNDQGYT